MTTMYSTAGIMDSEAANPSTFRAVLDGAGPIPAVVSVIYGTVMALTLLGQDPALSTMHAIVVAAIPPVVLLIRSVSVRLIDNRRLRREIADLKRTVERLESEADTRDHRRSRR